jgi:hypothetical protein
MTYVRENTTAQYTLKQIGEKFFGIPGISLCGAGNAFRKGSPKPLQKSKKPEADSYGALLTGKELEALIMDFPSLEREEDRKRIGSVLASRFPPD